MIKRSIWILMALLAAINCAAIENAGAAGGDQATENNAENTLIEIGLTIDRQKQASEDGAFTAEVMAHSGLVSALYNCQEKVVKIMNDWRKKYKIRLEEKLSTPGNLHLAFESSSPAGYFILDYTVSSSLDKAKIAFSFRSLANVRLSGDQVGLEPLGQDLLEAIQCVPR